MWMTDQAIVREYKEAKDKKKQIEILADENNCGNEEIEKILEDNGIDLAKKRGRKAKGEAMKRKLPEAVREALTRELIRLQEKMDDIQEKMEEINTYLKGESNGEE